MLHALRGRRRPQERPQLPPVPPPLDVEQSPNLPSLFLCSGLVQLARIRAVRPWSKIGLYLVGGLVLHHVGPLECARVPL